VPRPRARRRHPQRGADAASITIRTRTWPGISPRRILRRGALPGLVPVDLDHARRRGIVVEGELRAPRRDAARAAERHDLRPVGDRIGITLETTIDRTDFGIVWQMELPSGVNALENEVTLTADLELVKA
jgi:hypothetical protein